MAAAADDPEQSMEEILQSIKRIIADEDEESPSGEDKADPWEQASAQQTDDAHEEEDVLELTEMVDSDGSIATLDSSAEMTDTSEDEDVLSLDQMIGEEVDPGSAQPAMSAMNDAVDELVSDSVVSATASALQSLKNKPQAAAPATSPMAAPSFRSGQTVEDLAVEALKPMLKEWLDANLQQIVERIVEREVRRIADN